MESSFCNLKEKYEKYGQGHVFKYWEELGLSDATKKQREKFLEELSQIDLDNVDRAFKEAQISQQLEKSKDEIEPLHKFDDIRTFDEMALYKEGLLAVGKGKIGLLLLAGGQGTRLSTTAPKGTYDIGLPSKKTLFEYQAQRLLRIQKLAFEFHKNEREKINVENKGGCSSKHSPSEFMLFWYIMTSSYTDTETKKFFKDHNYFGLSESQIFFFQQSNFPCLDFNGKILLESKGHVSFAPNGNGGLFEALEKSGALTHMESNGIQWIHMYCVDNVLIRILDPVFIGYTLRKNNNNNKGDIPCDISIKVLPKRHWNEKVGVYAMKNKELTVIEYSEITEEMAKATRSTFSRNMKNNVDSNQKDSEENSSSDEQQLLFNHANIVIFLFSVEFLKQAGKEKDKYYLPYHMAKKKIPTEEQPSPTIENGIKMELFNFDIVKYAKNPKILQVERYKEFSPLKNGKGKIDSVESCLRDLHCLNIERLRRAGAIVKFDHDHSVSSVDYQSFDEQKLKDHFCELSPLLSYDGDGLEEFHGKVITLPFNWVEKQQ